MNTHYTPISKDAFKANEDLKSCDLVMKGGLTSGIVYSTAIPQLASQYRLKNIGGTSAGAIGAIIASSAEYRRQKDGTPQGFIETEALSEELANNLSAIFQPSHGLKSLYNALFNGIGKSTFAKIKSFIFAFWFLTLPIMPLVAYGIFKLLEPHFLDGMIFCNIVIYAAFFIPVLAITWALSLLAWILIVNIKALRNNHYGLCTGKTQNDKGPLAFSDWLAEKINTVAGLPAGTGHKPLCVKDLRKFDIHPATITTDLSTGRPYQLPLLSSAHYFQADEFRKLFPDWIMDYLIEKGESYGRKPIHKKLGLYKLAYDENMPVLMLVRLSLSFPLLISAVPLYRRDYTESGEDKGHYEKCIFSDGGISSNFPIHFFDSLLPRRPTFGISLNSSKGASTKYKANDRVKFMPPLVSEQTPVNKITGLMSFFSKIFGTAANWQDTLQSQLKGYADRIVEIKLDSEKEGGLNLNMPPDTIRDLQWLGQQAGKAFLNDFDEDTHRYYRAITSIPHIEALLLDYAENFTDTSEWSGGDWAYIFEDMEASYKKRMRKPAHQLAKDITALGEAQRLSQDDYRGKIRDKYGTRSDANIRLVADANRTPGRVDKST